MFKELITFVKTNQKTIVEKGLIGLGAVVGLVVTGVLVNTLSEPNRVIDEAVESAIGPEI
jgi:hypothetical protein